LRQSKALIPRIARKSGLGGDIPKNATLESFLSDNNGMVLALFRAKNGAEVNTRRFSCWFIQDSEQRVNEINQLLREDGYEVPKPTHLHGS
jgi:hypothetical protein